MLRKILVAVAILISPFNSALAESPVNLLLDRSGSVNHERSNELYGVLNAHRIGMGYETYYVTNWGGSAGIQHTWTPAETELVASELANIGPTNVGTSLAEVFTREEDMCPRYLVIVDGTPGDARVFEQTMWAIGPQATVVVAYMGFDVSPSRTDRWYKNIRTRATYSVYPYSLENFPAILAAAKQSMCNLNF